MKVECFLGGQKVYLIPYKKQHVKIYNDWMQDKDLLRETSSEQLNLDQEYDMQRKWFEDKDKLTFIIVDKSKLLKCKNELEAMCGDINAFGRDSWISAEISIMIAKKESRRRGFANEALGLFLRYLKLIKPELEQCIALINEFNMASKRLFLNNHFKCSNEKKSYFGEICLTCSMSSIEDCQIDVFRYPDDL